MRLQSKSGRSLDRYFPEIVEAIRSIRAPRFVLDGEIVVPVGDTTSFDALQQRLHPAASRVRRLATETPALFIAFDLLADARGHPLLATSLRERRAALEAFARARLKDCRRVRLSPATSTTATALRWFRSAGQGSLDGVIAKRLDAPYRTGARDGMQKIKPQRTADCVVGGFRYAERARVVGSLLLGLYDRDGRLEPRRILFGPERDGQAGVDAQTRTPRVATGI